MRFSAYLATLGRADASPALATRAPPPPLPPPAGSQASSPGERIAHRTAPEQEDQRRLLIERRHEIREICQSRGIERLTHFTRAANLGSIMTLGLQPVALALLNGLAPKRNDPLRRDGWLQASSVSISFPNYKMFYKLRRAEPGETWVVLEIAAKTLWTRPCAFCDRNAADRRVTARGLHDLGDVEAFRAMFASDSGVPSRQTQGLTAADPTDPQAEVLVFDVIPPDDIDGVVFADEASARAYTQVVGARRIRIAADGEGCFASRPRARMALSSKERGAA